MEQIADLVGFNFVIELVTDNNYGALDLETGQWNGLVRGIRNCRGLTFALFNWHKSGLKCAV